MSDAWQLSLEQGMKQIELKLTAFGVLRIMTAQARTIGTTKTQEPLHSQIITTILQYSVLRMTSFHRVSQLIHLLRP